MPARHESVHIHYRSLIEMVSMRQAAAWTASNLGSPPFEWSVSLPRMIDMRNAHVWDTWRHHNSHLDAKMGSMEGITPSILAIPVMRNSTRIKHVAHLVWLCNEVSLTYSKVLEVSKINHGFLCHLKEPKIPSRASQSRSFLNDPMDFQNTINLDKFYCKSCD
jgi:hypothetical protein